MIKLMLSMQIITKTEVNTQKLFLRLKCNGNTGRVNIDDLIVATLSLPFAIRN